MSEHATPARAPEALSAEALMKKYNLPSGTNDDAIARVLARLSELPVSGTPPPYGGAKPKSPGGKSGVGSPSSRRKSKSPVVAASSRRNAMHFTGGGAAIARVAWTPASPEPATPIDPLELLRESYADPNSDPSDADAHARAVVAAARASGAASSPTARSSTARTPAKGPVATLRREVKTATVALSPKERMGKMGELKYEAQAANRRAKVLERELRGREQEIEELKAKVAAMARERSALATLKARATAVDPSVSEETAAAAKRLPGTPNAAIARDRKLKTAGERLSMSSRWNQWEMEARRGDKRMGLLLRNYKNLEKELEGTQDAYARERASHAFSKNELAATRAAMRDLEQNFEAAEELLNEGLETKDALEGRLRAETAARVKSEPELARLREKNEELVAEAESNRGKIQELLQRTVKRDHRVEALTKKLAAAVKEKETSEAARAKAEEDLIKVEERARTLRKRVSTLEGKSKTSDLQSENARLLMELEIKEEECRMLAAMVSKAGNKSGGNGSVSGASRDGSTAKTPRGLGGVGVRPKLRRDEKREERPAETTERAADPEAVYAELLYAELQRTAR